MQARMRPTVLTEKKVRAGPPLLAFRFDQGDTEHSIITSSARASISRKRGLKDVEGEQRIGEKQDAGQRHDWDSGGKFNGFGHRQAWFYV